MAGNKKISELTELAILDLDDNDVVPVVDGSDNETKKIKSGSLRLRKNNVIKYGADPTGVADSTAAFVACLAANDVAYVADGTYIVGDLELNAKKIEGAGGTIKRKTGATYAVIMQGENPEISGITFNTLASAVNGESEIKLDDGASYCIVRNCKFTGTLYATVSADANGADDTSLVYENPVNGFTFEGNTVFGAYSRHLYLHNIENIRIVNNSFRGSTRDSIRLRQATTRCLIHGNTFDEIGLEYPDIVERPLNWSSLTAYTLGQRVSIPPNGIFQCIVATSTIGANPTTSGASEWTNVAPAYFETKDVLDAFWSGRELIITSNILKKCASLGFGIKGVEPNGDYATGRVVISNNYIEGCFGSAIELSNSQNTLAGDFRPSNQYIITSNIIRKNNRERFDVTQAAIYIRQGCRSVIISNNIIDSNYAKGIYVRNADQTAGINRDILIQGNQIYSNGIPGNPAGAGIQISPVNGLQVLDNIVRNYTTIEEYKMTVAGTATADETITFPARNNAGGSISVAVLNGDTFDVIKSKIVASLRNDYPVVYETITSTYYTNVREELGVASSVQFGPTVGSGRLVLSSDLPGTQGDGYTLVTIVNNTLSPTVYPTNWTWDSGTNTLTVYIRSTTKPFHFIAAFNASAPADARAVLSVALLAGEPSDVASQAAMTGETVSTSGGVDGDELWFDARLENILTPGVFTGSGYTVTLTRDPLMTNSVQTYGAYIKDTEVVGSTTFTAPNLSYIIKNNLLAGNSVGDRFGLVMNDVEMPALLFYVDSNNVGNNTIVTTQARTKFSTGSNSQGGLFSVSSTQAFLIVQGMILRARDFGEVGNSLTFEIEQQTGNDQPLRLQIAPLYAGGKDVVLRLPTDGSGNPLATSVEDVEAFLKTRCAQGTLACEDNYINLLRPQREGIKGDPAVGAMTSAVSTTEDVEVFRGTGKAFKVGKELLEVLGTGFSSATSYILQINADPTKYDVGAIVGHVVGAMGSTYTEVDAAADTGRTPGGNGVRYIYKNADGTTYEDTAAPTPAMRRQKIYLGRIIVVSGTVVQALPEPVVNESVNEQLYDLAKAIRIFNITGNQLSANGANLKLNKSAGSLFSIGANYQTDDENPHQVTTGALTALTFQYITQTAASGSDVTDLDPTKYDVAGTATTITGNNSQSSVQRVYLFPSGSVRIAYGQRVYNTLAEAVAGAPSEPFTQNSAIEGNGVLIGMVAMTKAATSLQDTSRVAFIPVSRFGDAVVGSAAGVTDLTMLDPRTGFELFEGWNSTTAVGNLTWAATANSGVNGMNVTSSTGREQGIMRLDTSTSSTSHPMLTLGSGSPFVFSTAKFTMETWYQVATLSTVTEEFIDRFGFDSSATSATPNNAVYFEYDRLNFGANWQAVSFAGGAAATRTDTGVAVSAGSWVHFKIEITANTDVKYYINDVLVATHASNFPTGTSQACHAVYRKIKSAGTTARLSYADWWRLRCLF